MVDVQRGDTRQYYTEGYEQKADWGPTLSGAVDAAVKIGQTAGQSKFAENQIDLNAKFMAKNNEINTKYQAEPNNPEREKELKTAFDELSSQYKVSPFLQREWTDAKNKIYGNYKTYNAEWAIKQNATNAEISLKNGLKSLLDQANNLGYQDADVNTVRMIYANGRDALSKGSIGALGEVTVNNFLKDSTHDFAVNYMNGLIQSNPAKALQMLNQKPALDALKKFKQGIKPSDYDTKLSKEDEAKFQQWVKDAKEKGIINSKDNFSDYDMRGYWKNEVLNNTDLANGSAEARFTDKYKKPNHPTFSQESIYATGNNAKYAGSWDSNGNYIPPVLSSDNAIINDIGDMNSVTKLQTMARTQLIKQNEINTVNRIAGYINNNNAIWNKALDGTITTVEAQNFLSDKNVDRNMRGILAQMLGYSSQQDLYVDAETGTIHSKEAESKKRLKSLGGSDGDGYGGSGSGGTYGYGDSNFATLTIGNQKWSFLGKKGKIRKANDLEKREITSALYLEGSRLLNGIGGKAPSKQIRDIASFASKVAQASYWGIDKGDYNNLMKQFVLPATKDIQEQAKRYNANISNWNPKSGKYGYEQIENYFNKNFEKPDSAAVKQEKALASVYYWSALKNYCSQKGISMKQLFWLSREVRASVYNKAAQQAIQKARSTTSAPQLWFRSANPQYVSVIRGQMPTNADADDVITNVAVACMSNPNMSDKDMDIIINREISKKYSRMRMEHQNIVYGVPKTKYDEIINLYSSQYGVDPLLVKAVMKQESDFKPNLVSPIGAVGLMQLMPRTASGMGINNPKDPKQNILGGIKYLSYLLKTFNGNTTLAVAAYNAGPNAVKKYGNKVPAYKETQNYVKNVMGNYRKYRG